MWPFRKKRKIKPVFKNIWFDFYTTDGENKFQLDQKLLYDVLDKEQVEYLNSLAPVQKSDITEAARSTMMRPLKPTGPREPGRAPRVS